MKLKLSFVCLTALSLAACGGGSSGGGGSDPDSAETGDGDGDEGDGDGGDGDGDAGDGDAGDGDAGDGDGDGDAPSAIEAEVTVSADIPGTLTVATVETEEDATIEWTLTSGPEGSDLTDEDLEGKETTEVSFVPEVAGTYELSVKVTGESDATTKHVEVEIVGYDIPFAVLEVTPSEVGTVTSHVSKVVSSGAGPARDIGCAHEGTADVTGAESVSLRRVMTEIRLPAQLEDPAAILSRVYSSNEEQNQSLEIATSSTSCDGTAPELVEIGAPGPYAAHPFRISPDGHRFLGVRFDDPDYFLHTASMGGDGEKLLASATQDSRSHMGWYDDQTVAITHYDDEGEDGFVYAMYLIPDQDEAAPQAEKIIDCTMTAAEDRILPSGQFIFRGEDLYLLSDVGLYLMKATEGSYDCDFNAETNTLLSGIETPRHFDVSADGAMVTFESADGYNVYTVPADGTSTPVMISPQDTAEHRFPRFALGGRQVVWTSSYVYDEAHEAPLAQANLTRVFRANADGSHPYVVWSSEVTSDKTVEATTGDQAGYVCSFGVPLGGGSTGLLGLGLGLAAALRRRRASLNRA